jgi:hypothetical protein
MITRAQAMTASRFHEDATCNAKRAATWRRNGATQTWKTRPGEFRLPVKYGIRDYFAITDANAAGWHTEQDCPHGHRW